MRRLRFLPLVLALLLCRSAAAEEFDLQDWLKRPGVRAVAVEFYASWCGPCQKAMPRFKALKDKFGKEGLRIVVVNTQEPPGKITRLDWTPDAFIADPDGQIAEQFGVGSSLPSAFVWSWNGQLLVRHGHITEVEGAVERVLKDLPRVALDVAPAVDDSVVEALKSRLLDSGKVVVVASDAERAKVQAEKIKRARDDMADDGKKCELGREVPPNALLKVATVGKASQLGLTVIDLESGCQKASVQVPYDILTPRDIQRTSLDAVEALLAKLRVPFERPTSHVSAAAKPLTPVPVPGVRTTNWALWGAVASGAVAIGSGVLFSNALDRSAQSWTAYSEAMPGADFGALHADYKAAQGDVSMYRNVAIGASAATVGLGVLSWILRFPAAVSAEVKSGGATVGVQGVF